MLDFLDPFWKWLFLGVDLDYFVNSSEYREGWWKYATTTYLGWLLGIGSVIMFVGLVMFAGLCGARRATFMTMLFVFPIHLGVHYIGRLLLAADLGLVQAFHF
ncbi:hypothetical protein FOZ60_016799 [Perkinsus olseni]|uniref:Uncharacterized protein n=1 Tax=Perkinsus olseni TaxID=32597 RepID=A0A7J6P4Y2_PEROL|nr:hypothetical protein FOZ60_016799 [Perkinsus olseni]